jgi:hypothetical protein
MYNVVFNETKQMFVKYSQFDGLPEHGHLVHRSIVKMFSWCNLKSLTALCAICLVIVYACMVLCVSTACLSSLCDVILATTCVTKLWQILFYHCWIWGSDSGDHEECWLLGFDPLQQDDWRFSGASMKCCPTWCHFLQHSTLLFYHWLWKLKKRSIYISMYGFNMSML